MEERLYKNWVKQTKDEEVLKAEEQLRKIKNNRGKDKYVTYTFNGIGIEVREGVTREEAEERLNEMLSKANKYRI